MKTIIYLLPNGNMALQFNKENVFCTRDGDADGFDPEPDPNVKKKWIRTSTSNPDPTY